MKVDLDNPSERLLVQEYVNHILNNESPEELDFHVHKLIHTYEVVEVAKDLIAHTNPPLSEADKHIIWEAALLHDIGRVKQFAKGKFIHAADHGQMGVAILQKVMPENKIVIETTRWHLQKPSDKDPQDILFYLNYVRDADIIANIRHNTEKMLLVYDHMRSIVNEDGLDLYLDDEVINAAKEKRTCVYTRYKRTSFLQVIVQEIAWKYSILTPAGRTLVQQEKLFVKLRDATIHELIDVLKGTPEEKEKTKKLLMDLYPDEVLNEY